MSGRREFDLEPLTVLSEQPLMDLMAHSETHKNAVIYRDWFGLGIGIGF